MCGHVREGERAGKSGLSTMVGNGNVCALHMISAYSVKMHCLHHGSPRCLSTIHQRCRINKVHINDGIDQFSFKFIYLL